MLEDDLAERPLLEVYGRDLADPREVIPEQERTIVPSSTFALSIKKSMSCESCTYHKYAIAAEDPARAFKGTLLPSGGTTIGLFMLFVLHEPLPLAIMYQAGQH